MDSRPHAPPPAADVASARPPRLDDASAARLARTNGHAAGLASLSQQAEEDSQARLAFEQARSGQRSAYGTVVRIYQHRLFNAVFRMVGNREDAAEVTQEAFTRGLEKLAEFRGDSGPYTWLFRIAMNAAVSRIRRSSRRRTVSLEAMDAGEGPGGGSRGRFADNLAGRGQSPVEAAQVSEAHRAVVAALDRLEPEYRALLVMRDLEGFDYRQMADVLGLPLGTLKSRLFRARAALRDLLEPQFRRKEGPVAGGRPESPPSR